MSLVTRPPMSIVVLSGNSRRPSRTALLSQVIGAAVAARLQQDVQCHDVAEAMPGLGAALSPDELEGAAARLVSTVARADALVVVSPVYNGSYPGLLKHLFDLVDPADMAGKPVLIAATGGGVRHALMVEHALRPLFAFFTSLTVPTALYVAEGELRDGRIADAALLGRLEQAVDEFAHLVSSRRPALRRANAA